jgi:UDP-N-acetylmuramoylalanine--D-glutamate ligase
VINTDYFRNKKITVAGLGRSGFASALLLNELGARVRLTDRGTSEILHSRAGELRAKGVAVELGRHSRDFIKGAELLVLSPGVDSQSQVVVWAQDLAIPIISEIECAYILCPSRIIAVTGTNGKTTVTSLIYEVLKAAGKRVHLCGNIGNPFIAEVGKMRPGDIVCLEVSSFQLERIQRFKPQIALILNFTPDHLDRYKTIEDYLNAKKRIFMNQDAGDYLVLNYSDSLSSDLAREAKAQVIYFNRQRNSDCNRLAVAKVAEILGISKQAISSAFSNFKGIEHRLEYVGEVKGIKFINDSKATNVESVSWALRNLNMPLVLIAGGRDKGADFVSLQDLIISKVKFLILIGEARQKIRKAFIKTAALPICEADSLEEAVGIAFKQARPGDCVLLSPMCASFDMFANFQERGDCFKRTVRELIRNCRK